MIINENEYYTPRDSQMRIIGSIGTLATWRSRGHGLPYTKSGSRILYYGKDILAFLERNRIDTTNFNLSQKG